MADSKVSDLTAITVPAGADELYIVDDPGGTPLSRKITVGNLRRNATEVAVNTTLDATHSVVNVDTSGGARTITLPDCATFTGKGYFIRQDGTSNVVVNAAGSDVFSDNGTNTTQTLSADASSIGIFSTGSTEWKIAGTSGTVTGS